MNKFYKAIIVASVCVSSLSVKAQMTGVQTVPGTFPTLAAAITALNTSGVGAGGATINVAAGYTETLSAQLLLTMATNRATATNPLIIQKSGAGANPLITAYTGVSTTVDGIFVLNGADYVTIDGIDLTENAANTTTTTQMEWGYGLTKTAATDGAQYNTIKNCTVTLNKANTASVGIYGGNHISTVTTALTVSNAAGTNSYNKFYNNTIQNCYTGYSINGFAAAAPFEFYDQGNQIGRDGVSTKRSQVIDFGGGTIVANGIFGTNQNAIKIFSTYINNGNAANTNTLNGISLTGGTNSNVDIYNDTITIASGAAASQMAGISNVSGGTGAGNTINIYNNVVSNCSYNTATTGEFRGIASTSTASYTNIYNNTVSGNTLSGTGQFSGIYYGGSSATLCLLVNLNNNTIFNNTKIGTAGQFNGIFANASSNTMNAYSNAIYNNSNALSSGATYGYYNFAFGLVENVYNNTVYNLTGGSGPTVALFVSTGSAPTNKEVYGNTVYGISANVPTTTTVFVGGIQVDYGTISNVYKNTIYDISNTTTTGAAGAVFGINVGNSAVGTHSSQTTLYNNFVSDLKAPNASNVNAVYGIWLQGTTNAYNNAYNNTVYLNASSTGANFGTSALVCATANSYDLRNNILVNNSVPAGTGLTRGITRAATALTNYASTSGYNCIYAGTPGASNIIYSDGTNNDQTLQAFKNRVGPREQASFSAIPPFINVATTPYDLHLNAAVATQCETGGKSISTVTVDYDGNTRGATPDVGADEITGITTDIASPDIQYTLLTNSSALATRVLTSFATITDPSGINTTSGTRPRLYYKKSTNANTFIDNTSGTDCWKYVEASNTSSPFSFTIDYSLLFGGTGVVAGDVIQYFVTAQDLNATPIVGLNNGGFTVQPSNVNLAAANFPLTNTINQYTIVNGPLSGVVNVGPAELITSLTNAGGAFQAINASVLSGNLILNITGDLTAETGTFALNQWAEEGAGNYSVSIVPSAATTRNISGSSAAASLIRFDGADRVMIDGRFGGSGTWLTFRNTSNSAPTIGYINDAQNNTLTYSIIESGNTSSSATLGGAILIGATTGANGNDNNTISFSEIRDRSDVAGTPVIGINCSGTNTALNQFNNNCVISNNNIHDWFLLNSTSQFAINMQTGNSGFTISNNSFYQTATRTNTASGAITRAININFSVSNATNGGHTITGNYIGGTAPGATGGDMTLTVSGAGVSQVFGGISVITGLIPNSIQNNTIRKIDFTTNSPAAASSMFIGMNLGQGIHNVGTVTGNTIGAGTGNDVIKITINAGGAFNSFLAGILASSANGYFNIQNNTIGGITIGGTTTAGGIIPQWIQLQGTPAQTNTISNNLIGSTSTANSIRVTATAPAVVAFGIRQVITTGAGVNITNNTIQNVTDLSTNAGSADYGMLMISQVGGQGTLNITNNTIKDFSSACAPATASLGVLGISLQGYAGLTHDISGNKISGIVNTNAGVAASYVVGIQTQGSSMGGTMNKNRIWDIRNANTGTTPGIAGIYFSAGLNWTVNNNRISISNTGNTNQLDVTGITDVVAQNAIMSLNYNSIYVGGTATGSVGSFAYVRYGNATMSFKNNLLYNERTGGSGNHTAIANSAGVPATGWSSNSSSNNAFVTADSTKIGVWGSTAVNLSAWKSNSGTDANSIANNNTGVTSAALFVSTANGDLHINTSTFPEALAAPIAGTTTDFDGDARSATFPTIGSDELPCSNVLTSLGSKTNVTCNGLNNGTATITATGGNGLTYNWSPSGGTTPAISSLAPGTYTCTVTNVCGNSNTIAVTITQPAVLSAAPSQTNVSCNAGTNGTASVVVSGGTTAYTYAWSSGGTASSVSGLAAGSYTCTITDANTCTTSAVFTITQPTTLTASLASQTNVTCNGFTNGDAAVSVNGGTTAYTYSWTSGGTAATETGLAAGTYTCTITDANLCTASQAVTITEPAALSASISSQTNITCNGGNDGAATLFITGGTPAYSYNWNSGSSTAAESNLVAGTYTCTVTDGNSCVLTQVVSITEPSVISVTTTSVTAPGCGLNNGDATVSATGGVGGYTYSWNTGGTAATETGLSAGNYTVAVFDGNACFSTHVVGLSNPGSPVVTGTVTANAGCAGQNNGAIDVSVSTGFTYSVVWNNMATVEDLTALTAGNYDITITDVNNCTGTANFTITEFALPLVFGGGDQAVCAGTSVTLSGSGTASSFAWDNAVSDAVAFTPAATLDYIVTGTDGNGCTNTDTVNVAVNALPVVTLSIGATDTVCLNLAPFALTGESPAGGTWSGSGVSGANFDPSTAAFGWNIVNYTYTDGNNCSAGANDSLFVDVCTGASNAFSGQEITLYPNPTKDVVIIRTGNTNVIRVSVMDVQGKVIQNFVPAATNAIIVDLSVYEEGMYMISIHTTEKIIVERVVKH